MNRLKKIDPKDPFRQSRSDASDRPGFTLVELLVVMATVALLAAVLVPALAGTRPNGQAFQCQNNVRRLALGWLMYASDNNDILMANPGWVGISIMEWGSGLCSIDVQPLLTNTMGQYVKLASVYKCPSDIYQSKDNLGPRVRSVSLNGALGGSAVFVTGNNPDGRLYYGGAGSLVGMCTKMSQLNSPGPARVYLVLDEQADSISAINGDATYAFAPGYASSQEQWRDLPASYHDGCGSFSFADGHTELHRWVVTSGNNPTTLPVTMQTYGGSGAPWKNTAGHSVDYEWVQDGMPYR
jgi:prepilin-type N-terminal cleavage/methylation domain-containing protein